MNIKEQKIEFANTLRGLAALFVLAHHLCFCFWVPGNRETINTLTNTPPLPETYGLPIYLHPFIARDFFDWGAYGVSLFFLISGFVIPFSFEKNNGQSFILNRFFRIFPSYFMGFTISLLAILLVGNFFEREFCYNLKEIFVNYIPGIRDIFDTKKIDGSIWTLEIEIKFYILCIFISNLIRMGNPIIFIIPVILSISSIFLCYEKELYQHSTFLNHTISLYIFNAPYIVFMFIGIAWNFYYRKIVRSETFLVLIVAIFILFTLIWRKGSPLPGFSAIWSYGFAVLTFGFAYAYPSFFKSNKLYDFLADISYPLYVIHMVQGYVLLRILLEFGLRASISLFITIVTLLSIAYIIHKYIEAPFQKFGKVLAKQKLPLQNVNLELLSLEPKKM